METEGCWEGNMTHTHTNANTCTTQGAALQGTPGSTPTKKWTLLMRATMQISTPPPSPPLPSAHRIRRPPPASPSSSCSESGLQFVPLPHTSLFKMTLLHFMVNQLFCLTQSAGSASQPAQINWGAGGGGEGGGDVGWRERERERETEGDRTSGRTEERKKRRLMVLSLTSPQGWSEPPEA